MKQYSKYSAKKSDQDLFLPFARNLDQAECKSGSESTRSSMESSLSPAPSPSPCTMLSDMNFQDDAPIKYKQYTQDIAQRVKTYQCPSTRKSRKRKLNADGTTNCLKRVTLSDGSVCYTMAPQPSTNSTPRHDSNPIRYPMSEPPKKKRRHDAYSRIQRSKTPLRPTKVVVLEQCALSPIKGMRTPVASKGNAVTAVTPKTTTSPPKTPKMTASKSRSCRDGHGGKRTARRVEEKKKSKPPLVHYNTMPAPTKGKNSKPKVQRRHTADWTSKSNLLSSLKHQEKLKDQLFPRHHVPSVNLEEIFKGQKFIRVHKQIRPINSRRETQMFHI